MSGPLGADGVAVEQTADGRRLVVSQPVDAPVETVWEILTDTQRWPEWGPSITAVDCADRVIERGSSGHVTVRGGLRLPFEVTTCRDHRWTWDVARIPATGHRVQRRDGGSTVAFEVPLLAAPYLAVCGRACHHIARLAEADGSA